MREKIKLKEKVLAWFMMAALVLTMVPAGVGISTEEASAATTYSFTVSRPTAKVNGHVTHVSHFTISSLGLVGACCQVGNTAKKGKTTIKRLSNTDIRTKLIYYYGYQMGYLSQTNKNGLLLGRSLSWVGGNNSIWPLTKSEIKKFINAVPADLVVPNRFEAYFCNPTNGTQNFVACRMTQPAYVTLNKTSTDAASMAAGSGFSFEGIEYTVYSGGAEVGKLTCNANGTTNTLTLDTGTYTVRETRTNEWYKLDGGEFTKTLSAGETWAIKASDSPQTGTVHIRKSVSGKYEGDLAFEFRLTNTANPNIVYTAKTDPQTGEADVAVVPGIYRCEEILPEDTELADLTGAQTEEVKIGDTVTFERENKVITSGMLQVSKSTNDGGSSEGFKFKVTGTLYNQGSITAEKVLEAAEPTIDNYDKEAFSDCTWEIRDEDIEKLNKAAENRETGTIKVPMKATLKRAESDEGSEGADDEGAKGDDVEGSQGADEESEDADTEISVDLPVKLLPVEYVYNSEEPEASTYETDIDKQICNKEKKTEKKGSYDITYNAFEWHGAATIYQEAKDGKLTGKNETEVETQKGGSAPAVCEGITYGKFTVEEIMTDAQKGKYRESQPQTKEITRESRSASFVFNFENMARWTGVGLVKTSKDGNVSGITFRLEGTEKSGNKIKTEAVTGEDGKIDFGKLYAGEYTISEVDFDPDKYENNDMLDGYDVPAKKLTVTGDETEDIIVEFENVPLKSLYLTKVDKDTKIFLKNAVFSLLEEGQQIALFRIVLDDYDRAGIDMIECREDSGIRVRKPQVTDSPDTDEEAEQDVPDTGDEDEDDEDITVVDPYIDESEDADESGSEEDDGEDTEGQPDYNFAVIKGLKEGKNYTLKEVTAPTGYAASVDYSFDFEDGQKLVLENAAPEIGTVAADKQTNMHMSDAEGIVTIVDTVSYTNLCPGHKYLMKGVLALKPDSGRTPEEMQQDVEMVEVVKDAKGKEVTAQKEFVPKEAKGTVDIEFKFDASLLDGRQVVAMEQLIDSELVGISKDSALIASHEDIEDEAQSIYFPKLETTASADDTGMSLTGADQEVVITDVVNYSNVEAGRVYEITGTLMDKVTAKPIRSGGKTVTSSVKFRADKDGPVMAEEGQTLENSTGDTTELVSGKVELKFRFDGTGLQGTDAVAFEKLTTEGRLVGEHSDINDKAQTVFLPSIETKAEINKRGMVADNVYFKRLLPGKTYVLDGVLMDKSTGGELLINDKPVESRVEFVPETMDGSILLEFPVEYKSLKDKTGVVFETCSILTESEEGPVEIEVASHRDINSKAQTVTARTPQTGQSGPWMLLIPSGLITAAGINALLRRLRRARKSC